MTLIELVVAVLILSIATVATYRSLDHSTRVIGGDRARLLAQTVALNRAEELRLYGLGAAQRLPKRFEMGPYSFLVETQQAPTTGGLVEARITARSNTGPGALFVTYLPVAGRP